MNYWPLRFALKLISWNLTRWPCSSSARQAHDEPKLSNTRLSSLKAWLVKNIRYVYNVYKYDLSYHILIY